MEPVTMAIPRLKPLISETTSSITGGLIQFMVVRGETITLSTIITNPDPQQGPTKETGFWNLPEVFTTKAFTPTPSEPGSFLFPVTVLKGTGKPVVITGNMGLRERVWMRLLKGRQDSHSLFRHCRLKQPLLWLLTGWCFRMRGHRYSAMLLTYALLKR